MKSPLMARLGWKWLGVAFALCLCLPAPALAQGGSGGEPQVALSPAGFVIDESFSGTGTPSGWSVVNKSGTGYCSGGWRFNNPGGRANNTGGSGNFAIADSDWTGYCWMDTELRTPSLNLSGYSTVRLIFRTHFRAYDYSRAAVDVSINGGSTWTNVWYRTSDYQGQVNLDISSLAARRSGVIVRFRYYNAYWDWWWEVDNVQIGTPNTAPTTPTSLSAALAAGNAINLSWQGYGAPTFEVERSLSSGSGFAWIATISNGATTYVDSSTKSANTTYYYRVRARNAYGTSGYSNVASARTGNNVVDVDVTISLYTNPANRAPYEAIIRYFADGVYEASNGANRLRRVTIYTGGRNSDRSHVVWIQSCWPNAHISGYTNPGSNSRIQMCDTFSGVNFLSNDCGAQGGGYTLAHEFGHYFYSLYDEYKGSQSSASWIGTPLSGDNAPSDSIMNSQWQARTSGCGGTGRYQWLNFSTAVNNPSTYNNAQRRCYAASGWDTLKRAVSADPRDGQRGSLPYRLYHQELAAVAPASGQAPSLQLPGSQAAARAALQIVWNTGTAMVTQEGGTESLTTASLGAARQLVLDVSDNMSVSSQLDYAKAALGVLVDTLPVGDMLGIIVYDGAVTPTVPLMVLGDAASRLPIKAAIANIAIGGHESAPGNALSVALGGLTAPAVPTTTNRAVYLLTTGQELAGTIYPLDVITGYQTAAISIYTFGYGVDEGIADMLQQVAQQTGGLYDFVDGDAGASSGLDDLIAALRTANQRTSPLVDVSLATGVISLTSALPITIPWQVDSTLGQLDLAVAYRGAPTSATLTLISPLGTTAPVTPCTAANAGRYQGTLCFMKVPAPATGPWGLRIVAPGATQNAPLPLLYWAGGTGEESAFTFGASLVAVNGALVRYPEPIVLQASTGQTLPVAGAVAVVGLAELPDGTTQPLAFLDTGLAPDSQANDGIFTAVLDNAGVGDYRVSVFFNVLPGAAQTETSVQLAAGPNGEMRSPLTYLVTEPLMRFTELQVNVIASYPNALYLPIVLRAAP